MSGTAHQGIKGALEVASTAPTLYRVAFVLHTVQTLLGLAKDDTGAYGGPAACDRGGRKGGNRSA